MKLSLAILITLLIATASGRELEVCMHLSGSTHGFGGSECDGENGHFPLPQEESHHEHTDRHSSHQGSGEHHEPCTHESVQVSEDYTRSTTYTDSFDGIIVDLAPPDRAVDFVDRSWLECGRLIFSSRAPPGTFSPQWQFATTIRFLI